FRDAQDFIGQRVLVVGSGASATQFLIMLELVTPHAIWVSRTFPRWNPERFGPTGGRQVEQRVTAQVTAGYAPRSVVSSTALALDQDDLQHSNADTLGCRGFIYSLNQHDVVLNGPRPTCSTVTSQGAAVDEQLHQNHSAVADMYRNTDTFPGY